jgi:hypothetical protein
MNGRVACKYILAGPKRYSLAYSVVKCRDPKYERLDSPDTENYAGKYPREAKVKKCKVPLRLFGDDGEKKEDGKSNMTSDYL